MIAIVNITPNLGPETKECLYSLRINHDEITRFTHVRAEGLGVCLMRASRAALLAEQEKASDGEGTGS